MSLATTITRIQTTDGNLDQYDHAISLVDTTAPDKPHSRPESPNRVLKRKETSGTIRKRIANRKYRHWQEDRHSKTASVVTNNNNEEEAIQEEAPSETATGEAAEETEALDFADGGPDTKPTPKRDDIFEIDVLYENQRGSFFLGIPLYSHSSLLNFDPSPWVTKDFKDSPVNITNAQVPDPSWQWAWKRWYVDMSADVDEEGWQYSFSFGGRFVWHGTHPWFHSFVRRRRWLRRRVKKSADQRMISGKPETMSIAHHLNADYFTIHPKRNRSPDSKRPESYVSVPTTLRPDEPPDEIKDIATLLRALKMATIDREKIDISKKFINSGGEELAYLGSHIPDIMSSLVFQNSRTQLLAYLKDTANAAQAHRNEHDAEEKPEGDDERRRVDNLLAAIEAADQQIRGLEYWSDRKHVLQTTDGQSDRAPTISTIFDDPAPDPQLEYRPVGDIKGISSQAELDVDPTHELMHKAHDGAPHDDTAVDKGKGKGKKLGSDAGSKSISRQGEDDGGETEKSQPGSPPRLKMDQVLIPDA